jgi:cytoskeleton protein RodZ
LVAVLLAAGGWWYQRGQPSAQTVSLDAAIGQASGPTHGEEVAKTMPAELRQLSSEAGQRLEQLEPIGPEALEASPESQARVRTPLLQSTANPQVSPTASPEADPEAAATVEASAPETSVESPLAGVAPAPEVTAPSGAAGQLRITVTADTWADIRDASGKKLVYNLLRSGRRLSLDGEPPLKLFFGNGHGVELRWKGQPVDLTSRIRADNTVRITLE